MSPIGDWNPYPREQQTRPKVGIPTSGQKATAEKKLRAAAIEAARDKSGRVICIACKRPIPESQLEVDHIIPRSRGKAATHLGPMHKKCHDNSHLTAEGQRERRKRIEKLKA